MPLEEEGWGRGDGGRQRWGWWAFGRAVGSRVGGEASDRCLTGASPRSPASAWSSSSPNALYPASSLSAPRMADGGSPFLGRRDFVYPSSARGEKQILLLFSRRRPPLPPPLLWMRWCPCRGGGKVTEPPVPTGSCPGQGGGEQSPTPALPPKTWPSQAEAVLLHRP